MASKKYSGVSRDKKNRIYFQTEFGKDPVTGKRRRKKSYKDKNGNPFRTEKQAYDELCRVRAEDRSQDELAQKQTVPVLTLEDFINTVFLPYYIKTVESSTYKTALTHFDIFKEELGQYLLSDISVQFCERFRLSLQDKYSPNYAKNVWLRFKKCLTYAERLEYIEFNPCTKLDNIKGERTVTSFWTVEDFQKAVNAFDRTTYQGVYYYTVIWLYFMTGLRVSEGLSLIWSDIDFESKLLHVQSTLEYDENGNPFRKNKTKTEAGTRYVELDDMTLQTLKEWKEVQIHNSLGDFVLAREEVPMHKTTLTRLLKRVAKEQDLPVMAGKGLRHSHDSFLINVLHKDVLYVSARSGRTDKATTLNTYAHIYAKKKAEGGREITKALESFGFDNPTKTPPSKEEIAETLEITRFN
ncbi:TPA: site-specific integrase [Streptococcus agalactiae]|nr:site-specific integrase [Streptococcus agalactiae]